MCLRGESLNFCLPFFPSSQSSLAIALLSPLKLSPILSGFHFHSPLFCLSLSLSTLLAFTFTFTLHSSGFHFQSPLFEFHSQSLILLSFAFNIHSSVFHSQISTPVFCSQSQLLSVLLSISIQKYNHVHIK